MGDKLEKMEFFGEDMLPNGTVSDPDEAVEKGVKPADFGLPSEEDPDRAFEGDDGELPREKRSRGRPALYTDDPSKTVPVKGIPKRMLTIAKNAFPGDVSQRDAFVAYLVVNCPEFAADRDLRRLGLTPRQKALVEASRTSEYMALSRRTLALSGKIDRANKQLSAMMGMLAFLMYEYSGLCTDPKQMTASRIADQDFMAYDGGNFLEYRDALLSSFLRFMVSTRTRDGEFFGDAPKRRKQDDPGARPAED